MRYDRQSTLNTFFHHTGSDFHHRRDLLPVAALVRLANDSDENVRRLVASHPALPLEQQLQLAEDISANIRQALLSKSIVPREVLRKLENDTDEMTTGL